MNLGNCLDSLLLSEIKHPLKKFKPKYERSCKLQNQGQEKLPLKILRILNLLTFQLYDCIYMRTTITSADNGSR
jgi:hypothetical protein